MAWRAREPGGTAHLRWDRQRHAARGRGEPLGVPGPIAEAISDFIVRIVNARADHVGSLLRPPELLARARGARRRASSTTRRSSAWRTRLFARWSTLQESAGCEVVTDGELRRESFQSELTASVDGVEGVGIDAWLWGDWHSDAVGDEPSRGRRSWL